MTVLRTPAAPAGPPRPPGPRGLPMIGSLLDYWKDPAGFLVATREAHGAVSRIRMGPYLFTLVTSASGTRQVLLDNHGNYRRGTLYEQFELVMGSGLLTQDHAEWRPHRRVMQPAFMRSAMEGYFPYVTEQTEAMLARWRVAAAAGEPVELVGETLRLASAVITSALFGFDIDVDDREERLKTVVDESIDVMFPHGSIGEMLPEWVPTKRNRSVVRNRRVLHDLATSIRTSEDRRGEARLLTLLEEAAAREEDPWDGDEVRDEILTMYLAGHETTAMGLCWSLLSVADSPQVRERLEAEVASIDELTFEGLSSLDYTEAVVSETLRLYPPIWLFPRDAIADDEIDGYAVPAGSSVLLCPLIAHRDPAVWPSPDVFDPDRFLPGAPPRPKASYFPFGLGARQCIGNIMAMMELKAVLAAVTREFRLELQSGLPGYGDSVVSLRPTSEAWAKLIPRDGDTAS